MPSQKADVLETSARPISQRAPTLTPREHAIIDCLTMGQSNKEIAATLSLSDAAIKTGLHLIYAKMGVADRLQAALRALDLGIVSR